MPSFDIVSEVDLQEIRNAVENANREVSTRFDFRNVSAEFELNEKNETIKITSESDFQVKQLVDILRGRFTCPCSCNMYGKLPGIKSRFCESCKEFENRIKI